MRASRSYARPAAAQQCPDARRCPTRARTIPPPCCSTAPISRPASSWASPKARCGGRSSWIAALVEARIRLAHVLGEMGKADEGAALARDALAKPLPPFLDDYGAMVLGRNEARLGRAAEARAAFDRAATLFPHAQAAARGVERRRPGGGPRQQTHWHPSWRASGRTRRRTATIRGRGATACTSPQAASLVGDLRAMAQ